jgi:hypothetical protein
MSIGDFRHLLALFGILVNPDVFISYIQIIEYFFSHNAKWAESSGIHHHFTHDDFPFFVGKEAAVHSDIPPASRTTFSKPRFFNVFAIDPAEVPILQTTTTG